MQLIKCTQYLFCLQMRLKLSLKLTCHLPTLTYSALEPRRSTWSTGKQVVCPQSPVHLPKSLYFSFFVEYLVTPSYFSYFLLLYLFLI